MPLQKLKFAPGIDRERTRYANEGTYWDCDKIRFKSGLPQKIGGWTDYAPGGFTFEGACRAVATLNCDCGASLVFLGTNLKFYVESGGVLFDITPAVDTNVIASNAFTTATAEPALIQINDAAGATAEGEFVVISGVASPINGVPATEINGVHRVVSVGTGSFKVAITTAPTSSGAGGSATVAYLVPVGADIYTVGLGWGADGWGASGWGSPATSGIGAQLRVWNIAQYGEAIIFGPRGGPLYFWQFVDQSSFLYRGTAVADAAGASHVPLFHNDVLVSDQSRFVVTIGSNDYGGTDANPMLVRWSDQENYLEWEPRALTQAGSMVLSSGSELVTLRQARQEILVWSDTALYSMQFIGAPLVFQFNLIAVNTTIMGQNAVIVADNVAYWMGRDKFYIYSGRTEVLPCTVHRYVFEDFNYDQSEQVFCGAVRKFGEVVWLYCSKNSDRVDRYVVFNYEENCWYYGTIERTAWLDAGTKDYPIAAGYDSETETGKLYYHEFGNDDSTTAPATPIPAFIETADFDIDDGERFAFVTRILPDLTFAGSDAGSPSATFELLPRRFPGSDYASNTPSPVTRSYAAPVEQYTEQVFVRYRGRQMAFRVSSDGRGVAWRLGVPRIQIRTDGRK